VFRFKCVSCDEWHEGMPCLSIMTPAAYETIPPAERKKRGKLTSDICVIDREVFMVRGNVEIRVEGETDPFAWGVWVRLERPEFTVFKKQFHRRRRSHVGPLAGVLAVDLGAYPETWGLGVRVHLRDDLVRPFIEMDAPGHPMTIEQQTGMTVERVAHVYAQSVHGD